MVRGFAYEKELSQQHEALLKNELLFDILVGVSQSCKSLIRYLLYNMSLCEFTHNLSKSIEIIRKKNFFTKFEGSSRQVC